MEKKEQAIVKKEEPSDLETKGRKMTAPPFALTSETESSQSGLANDDLVVRGGMSDASNLITNQQKDSRGHISANASPGASLEDLATSPVPFPNGSITVATVGDIRAIQNDQGKPMDVLEDPTKNNPLHASIEPHTKAISEGEAGKLSKAFTAQPNTWKKK